MLLDQLLRAGITLVLLSGAAILTVDAISTSHRIPPGHKKVIWGSFEKGKRLDVNVGFSEARKTVVLVLQEGCHFCAASMPFYRIIANEVKQRSDLRLAVLIPTDADHAKRYLDEHALEASVVRQASFEALGVVGTPTLLIVDASGAIVDVWQGVLSDQEQRTVLATMK
jgi:hypothetical protein